MEECAVEGIGHLLQLAAIAGGIVCLAHHAGSLDHQLQVVDVMGGGHQWHWGVLGESGTPWTIVVPVAQTVAHNAFVRTFFKIIYITCHGLIVVGDERAVAIHVVIHEGQDDERASPFGRIVKQIAE